RGHLRVGAGGADPDLPRLRRGRSDPARRRRLLPDLQAGDDEPGLPAFLNQTADARRLARGLVLITLFMAAEVVAGVLAHSLAPHELAHANRESLNVEGSFQHLLTDLFAFAATAVAGAVILATGFDRADGIAALAIAAVMARASIELLRASGRVLLEMAPETI